MSQLPLFAQAGDTVLVDDARGRIVYTPDFVPAEVARGWFEELRDAVAWEAQRRRMYDREVDVPRLVGHFPLTPAAHLPEAIRAAARRVVAATGVAFTSVGLNYYRDGRDSVAPHNDHLDEIAPGCPIVLLSLGATRRMTIRAKAAPRRVFHVDLAGGSLFVMSYETQLHYTHGVPKTSEPVGARISLAFRVRPAADHGSAPQRIALTGFPRAARRTATRTTPRARDAGGASSEAPES
jgi:alkylated DNA repair dioxygenase AlkB